MKLRSGMGLPPGGIIFTDPRVPGMTWQDAHTFLDERVREVISFRAQNPKYYPPTEPQWFDPVKVAQEITDYNCQRLGNNPNYCFDEKTAMALNVDAAKGVAPTTLKCSCGSELLPRYCKTCGGQKIVGYNCPVCGKVY